MAHRELERTLVCTIVEILWSAQSTIPPSMNFELFPTDVFAPLPVGQRAYVMTRCPSVRQLFL